MAELYFRQNVDEGLKELDEGKDISYEEGKGLRDFAPKVEKSADFSSKSYFSSKVEMRERFKYNSNLFKNKKLRNFR
jgi:hypothetical protein